MKEMKPLLLLSSPCFGAGHVFSPLVTTHGQNLKPYSLGPDSLRTISGEEPVVVCLFDCEKSSPDELQTWSSGPLHRPM